MEVLIPPKAEDLKGLIGLILDKMGFLYGHRLLVSSRELDLAKSLGFIIIRTEEGIEVTRQS